MTTMLTRVCVRPGVFARRALHSTPIALKKKSKARPVLDEDPFAAFDGDLISSGGLFGAKQTAESPAASASTPTPVKIPVRKRLAPEVRTEKFNQLYESMLPRIGKRPEIKHPKMRHSTWTHLINLAQTPEELERIIAVVPTWQAGGHKLSDATSELFVRRCEELKCPLLALKVYGNYPKYAVNLTLTGAQQLLHSLHAEHSIGDVATAVALYPIYNLPPVTEDLVSSALFLNACMRSGTPESLEAAALMVPAFKKLLLSTPRTLVAPSRSSRSLPAAKANIWLKWSLKRLNQDLARRGENVDWMLEWRQPAGRQPQPVVQS